MREIRHYVKTLYLRNQNCGALGIVGGIRTFVYVKFKELITFLRMDLVEEAR